MGSENPFTCLVWPLSGQDPDEAYSAVPYEKVSRFLFDFTTLDPLLNY